MLDRAIDKRLEMDQKAEHQEQEGKDEVENEMKSGDDPVC